MPNYAQYQEEVTADVAGTLKALQCQPIIFVGSGFSLRYANGPTWEALLNELAAGCPLVDKDFAYYKQKYDNDLTQVGSIFAERYFEWAWSPAGKKHFPAELFAPEVPRDAYLKHAAAHRLLGLSTATPGKELLAELTALKQLGPHAAITTNYDNLLEPHNPKSRLVANAHFMWAFCFVSRFVTRSVASQISLHFELTLGHVTGFGKIWH